MSMSNKGRETTNGKYTDRPTDIETTNKPGPWPAKTLANVPFLNKMQII